MPFFPLLSRASVIASILCAVLLSAVPHSSALSLSAPVVADAYVGAYWQWPSPNTSFYSSGSESYLQTSYYSGSSRFYEYFSFLKFDLSDVPGDATLQSLELRIRVRPGGYSQIASTIHRVADDSWIESGAGAVTYNTKPATADLIASPDDWAWVGDWASIALPVGSWISGDLADDFLSVRLSGSASGMYASREADSGSGAAYIVVGYVPEPSALALLATGLLLTAGRRRR